MGSGSWHMRAPYRMILVVMIAATLCGCSYRPSFDERSSYATLQEARALAAPEKGPIAIEWSPRSFPDRVDVALCRYIYHGVAIAQFLHFVSYPQDELLWIWQLLFLCLHGLVRLY